ncbi:hypothetical protein CY34DRAFT_479952 [Suillus luteus UH-Slu-Lm8-n1]|uniref:Uncharacterized protein n=1 Tax=Suillus luteus UH-Slu-Lm8-n1 TaxID=930992 RepID=A0A0C9ZI24_9AGAM|nr:hypothetical protein CY34DRAFT_479952 [Suillus luteus UH-Slu-Lm8-n1]
MQCSMVHNIMTKRLVHSKPCSPSLKMLLTRKRKLRQQYVSQSDAEIFIQEIIKAQLDDAPHRLLNTYTRRLCDREVQIDSFKTSTEYKELLSSILVHEDLRIKDVGSDCTTSEYQYLCCIFGSCQSNNLLAVYEVLEKPLPYIV